MSKHEAIALYQPLLKSIALRLVGSLQDAEDIVQDTFEKWLTIDTSKIQNTKAYLIRSVRNNSIKFLNSWKERSFLKGDSEVDLLIEDESQPRNMFHFDMENQMNQAWSVLHKKLEPVEKSIFVMREAFNLEYDEMQELFDKKVENLRKIVSRAKKKIQDESHKLGQDLPKSYIPSSFKEACSTGHLSEMVTDFRKEMRDRFPSKK